MSGHSCIHSRIASAVITAAALIGASCLMPESFASSSTRASRQHSTAKRSVWRAYETLAGRAFGELDVNDIHNSGITDITLAPRDANGRVEYTATFFLVKSIDMLASSHLDGSIVQGGSDCEHRLGLGELHATNPFPATPSPIAGGYLVAPTRAAGGASFDSTGNGELIRQRDRQ